MVVFTSWDICQYVYFNFLLTSLGRHKFWNWPYLSNQTLFLNDRKVKTKIHILRTKRAFKVKWKASFIIIKRNLNCQKLSQTWKCAFKNENMYICSFLFDRSVISADLLTSQEFQINKNNDNHSFFWSCLWYRNFFLIEGKHKLK